MSNPANAQNPYSTTQGGAPAGYPQQAPRRSAPLDRAVLRQIQFGGAIVVGIAILASLTQIIGSAMYSFRGEMIFSLFWSVFTALIFVVGAGASALYVAPLARATSTVDLLKKLAIAAGVGAGALLVFNFVYAVVTGGQYLVQMIVSAGILGSISTGVHYGAFFALGVFVARALPASQAAAPAPGYGQGYPGQPQAAQAYAPQPASGVPYGYPQAPAVPQGYPQAPAAPQGYPQAPMPNPYGQGAGQAPPSAQQ
ncbi:hypothetical protein [Mycetocola sp. 2940]|uniref:hypothetical protein n=1 Tax=Mycetocola sp. 2940 TaxID=3156452 RepID=UPI003399EA90